MAESTPVDLEKLRSLSVLSRGHGPETVREFRRPDGVRCKATTDELGNTVTQHAADDRQDVHIKAPTIRVTTRTEEVRPWL